jgi:HD-GYP domain-containing protein (c-di-GMP phosphodiesterase class II)
MRFIPSNCLRIDQTLASDLVLDRNRILLRRGVALTQSMISKIRQLGFQGVYIDDDISRDIMVADIISDELKYKAKKEIRSLFVSVEQNIQFKTSSHIDALGKVITGIVDELLYNRHVMVNIVDLRTYDDYTYSHSINVSVLAVVLGSVLGMDRKTLNDLAMGALIHDIGKVFIDKRIINKASKLTLDEFEEIKKHSLKGYTYLCSNSSIPENSKCGVLAHHEQFNGEGYPYGLAGEEINLFGRIICVADVYDALISDRPYRRAMLPSDAMEYIMSGYNTMFDPRIVEAFTRKVAPYPVGTCVRLSSGITGIVVKNFESACLRPKLRVIRDNKPTNEFMDLAHDRDTLNVTIKEIVNY